MTSSSESAVAGMPTPVSAIVLSGPIATLSGEVRSAIAKTPVDGPWEIGSNGLPHDEHGDMKAHGGPEKALLQYPREHYAAWAADIGDHPLLARPGAFGENLSTTGWSEHTICIGDVIRFGGAVLQVAQGRQPCFKLNLRFGLPDLAVKVQTLGRTGWYYRVLEPGVAKPADRLELADRPNPGWPMARLITLLYRRTLELDQLSEMAAIPELAEGWRKLALRRIESRQVENWSARLG
jgi:MOSC domain-containing protein YiiM